MRSSGGGSSAGGKSGKKFPPVLGGGAELVGSALVARLLDSPDAAGVRAVGELARELAAGVRR